MPGDIITDPDIEILNPPQQHIATLDDNAELVLEITVDKGRGYRSADRNKKPDDPHRHHPGGFYLFPPGAQSQLYGGGHPGRSENRLRQAYSGCVDRRDYLPPRRSGKSGRSHSYRAPGSFTDLTETGKDMEIMVEREEEEEASVLDMTIEELDLSVRSYNCLKRAGGVNTVEQLVQKKPKKI